MTTDNPDKQTMIGTAPIEFAGYQDGWISVMAFESTSPNSPCFPRRAVLFAGLGAHSGKERDGDIAAALTPEVATDLAHRLAVAAGPEASRDLVAKLTAWLDAPRLAARETAEVVASDQAGDLLRTSAGEWGVRFVNIVGGRMPTDWHAGPDAERNARSGYAYARDKALCVCGAECDEDEIDRSGEEPQCPKCVAEAVESFKATAMRCTAYDCKGSPCYGHEPCGWTGTGADLSNDLNGEANYECPKCGAYSVEEIGQ